MNHFETVSSKGQCISRKLNFCFKMSNLPPPPFFPLPFFFSQPFWPRWTKIKLHIFYFSLTLNKTLLFENAEFWVWVGAGVIVLCLFVGVVLCVVCRLPCISCVFHVCVHCKWCTYPTISIIDVESKCSDTGNSCTLRFIWQILVNVSKYLELVLNWW